MVTDVTRGKFCGGKVNQVKSFQKILSDAEEDGVKPVTAAHGSWLASAVTAIKQLLYIYIIYISCVGYNTRLKPRAT